MITHVRYHHESPPEPCVVSDPQSTMEGPLSKPIHGPAHVSYNGQCIYYVQSDTLITGQIQPPHG